MHNELEFLKGVKESAMNKVAELKRAEDDRQAKRKELQLDMVASPEYWSYCTKADVFIYRSELMRYQLGLNFFTPLLKELGGKQAEKYVISYQTEFKCDGLCQCDECDVFLVGIPNVAE